MSRLSVWIPGYGVAVAVAVLATAIAQFSAAWLGAGVLALLGGMVLRLVLGSNERLEAGFGVAVGPSLKLAIVLLGASLDFELLSLVGPVGAAIGIAGVILAWFLTLLLGRALGVESSLSTVLAAGISVCGATAILSVGGAIRAAPHAIGCALLLVTLMGALSMTALPAVGAWLGLSDIAIGIWAGASLHELAHVTGAAFAVGEDAGAAGTTTKLLRVAMLAPLILSITWAEPDATRRLGEVLRRMWYVIGFVLLALVGVTQDLPQVLLQTCRNGAGLLIATALASLGLGMRLDFLRTIGWRPVAVAMISSIGLVLITLIGVVSLF